MCGIVGFAARSQAPDRTLLDVQRDTLRHRGPDDAGTWWSADGRAGLGHRRLSIIDLSAAGHQPMLNEAGTVAIVFNGEIYNYRDLRHTIEQTGWKFRSSSDTEVLLAAYALWGPDCLERIWGMYAFAIYNHERHSLFLARDRAGEKPLFYSVDANRLVFGSELKSLMADPALPRVLDRASLEFYLAYGYVPGDRCILRGVNKLPQGHALLYELNSGALRVWRYWDLPDTSGVRTDADAEELADELQALLQDAVRRQLTADVPVGVLLSGGLDSSLVTAMAARESSAVKTFTVSLPGHGVYDEGPYARMVAEHFGTQHTELVAEPMTVDLLPMLARQYDEPMADSSMIPTYLVSRMIREHATVALGGDGADELFGGYHPYSWVLRQEQVRRFLPRPVLQVAGGIAENVLPVGFKGRNYLIGAGGDFRHTLSHLGLYFDRRTRRRLLVQGGSPNGTTPERYRAGIVAENFSPLQRMTRTDFRMYLVDDILVKVDRASMLTSLEVRAPWLDHRIIEFAYGRTPDYLKATATDRKILLRIIGGRLLPSQLDLKRKQGFSLPLNTWFKGAWGDYFRTVLKEADPRLFNRKVVGELIEGQQRGRANTHRLYALTLFELWRREYDVALS